MGDEEKQPEPQPLEHADVCHTAEGHQVPDGCTDEHGAPLVKE